MVNKDLKNTCELNRIPYNIKSHSFRINVISSLLKVTSVQNTADIIGHEDIRSTMNYRRYSLSKSEVQDLLSKINDDTLRLLWCNRSTFKIKLKTNKNESNYSRGFWILSNRASPG